MAKTNKTKNKKPSVKSKSISRNDKRQKRKKNAQMRRERKEKKMLQKSKEKKHFKAVDDFKMKNRSQPPFSNANTTSGSVSSSKKSDANESLRAKMEKRLQAAKFKMINEDLGASNIIKDPKSFFNNDKQIYEKYLETLRDKSKTWPWHPITSIIEYINKASESAKIVDLGCGEAEIAQNIKQKDVCSFDLFAVNEFVTACDNMKETGLPDSTIDIGVFCNSLMANEIGEFIQEANRILKSGGKLLIAEVASRFGKNLKKFKFGMRRYGFQFSKMYPEVEDISNEHFILLIFVKKSKVLHLRDGSLAPLQLLPSKYKPR